MLEYYTKPAMHKWAADERTRKEYSQVCHERRKAYMDHMRTMNVPQEINAWAVAMEQKYGPKAKVWMHDVDWVTALMIVRYGEDASQWPKEFTEEDAKRAMTWFTGANIPEAVLWRINLETQS